MGVQELIEAEVGLANYNNSIVEKIYNQMIKNHVDLTDVQPTIEFGAGAGALAEIFRANYAISPICVEIDPKLTNLLVSKGFLTY